MHRAQEVRLTPPRLALLTLLGVAACEGPTLEVGQRLDLLGDAAGPEHADAGDDAGGDGGRRRRDASLADRDETPFEGHPCRDERDCALFNIVRMRCSPVLDRCVQCLEDRHCASGECAPDVGECVPDHRGNSSGPGASDAPSPTP